jgi:hypothetical protein
VNYPNYLMHSKDALHYFMYRNYPKNKLLTNIWYKFPDICSGKILLNVEIIICHNGCPSNAFKVSVLGYYWCLSSVHGYFWCVSW